MGRQARVDDTARCPRREPVRTVTSCGKPAAVAGLGMSPSAVSACAGAGWGRRGRTTGVRIVDIEWDDQTSEHLARHGVTVREVIRVLHNRHQVRRSRKGASRVTLTGETDGGRLLEIALDPSTEEGTRRLVTAFDAGAEARARFRQHEYRHDGGVPSIEMGDANDVVEVHEGHPVGLVVRLRLDPDEALAFAEACEREGLSPTELLRAAYREYAARRTATRATG